MRAGLNRSLAFPLLERLLPDRRGGPLVALRPRDTALRPTVVPAAAAAAGEYPALYKTLLAHPRGAGRREVRLLVSYPKFGKHVRFDGRVYHGGLGELAPPTSSDADLRSRWSSPLGPRSWRRAAALAATARRAAQDVPRPEDAPAQPGGRRRLHGSLPDEVASSCWPDGFAAHATLLGVRRVDRRRGDERRLAATDVVLAHGAAGGDAGHFEVRLPATGTEDDGSGDAVLVDAEP